MGGELHKVRPGDELRIPARAYNAFVDLANRGRFHPPDGNAHLAAGQGPHVVAAIQNETGSALAPHDVVAIDGIVVEVEDAPLAERLVPTLKAIVPDAEHVGALAIVLDAIPAGRIGQACVGGVALAKVQMVAEGHRLADLWPEDLHKLRSGTNGCVSLLWVQPPNERTVTGVAWCVVRLAGHGQHHWSGKIVTEGPHEEEDFTDERYWIEKSYESNTTPTSALTLEAHPTSDPEAGVVMATNYAESLAHTHKLQPGQYVHVFETVDRTTDPPTIRYFFTLMPVMLAVWLGGSFSTVGSRACAGVCESDPQRGTVPLAQTSDVHRAMEFHGLAWFQGKLYGVGVFNLSGTSRRVIVRDADTGEWSSVPGAPVLDQANCLCVSDDGETLYVGGSEDADPYTRAVWAYDGTTWTAMPFSVIGVVVNTLKFIDGVLHAGCSGLVTATEGGIARRDGGVWVAVAGGVKWQGSAAAAQVHAVCEHAGLLHIGGLFDWPGDCKWVAKNDGGWKPVGKADETSDFGSPCKKLLSHRGKLYGLAGPSSSGTYRKPLGVLNGDDERWENAGETLKSRWGAPIGHDMLAAGDYLLLVGRFDHWEEHVPLNTLGSLTTRTSDTAGTVTLEDGHELTTGTFDLAWDTGVRVGVSGTVTGDALAFSGGSGSVLPEPVSGNYPMSVTASPAETETIDRPCVNAAWYNITNDAYEDFEGGVGANAIGLLSPNAQYLQVYAVIAYTVPEKRGQRYVFGGIIDVCGGVYSPTIGMASSSGGVRAQGGAFQSATSYAPRGGYRWATHLEGSLIAGNYLACWNRHVTAADVGGVHRIVYGSVVRWDGQYFRRVGLEPFDGFCRALATRDGVPVVWAFGGEPHYLDDETDTWELLSSYGGGYSGGEAMGAVEFDGEVWFALEAPPTIEDVLQEGCYVGRTAGLAGWVAVATGSDFALCRAIGKVGENLIIGGQSYTAAVKAWNGSAFAAVGDLTGEVLELCVRMEGGALAIYAVGPLSSGGVDGEFWKWTSASGWVCLAVGPGTLNTIYGVLLDDAGEHLVYGDFGFLDDPQTAFPAVARLQGVNAWAPAAFGGANGIVTGMHE